MANPDEEADQGDGRNAVKDEQTPLKEHGKCQAAKRCLRRSLRRNPGTTRIRHKQKSKANPAEEADQGDGRNAVKDEQTPLKEHGARDGDDAGKDRVDQKRRRTFDSHEDIGVT